METNIESILENIRILTAEEAMEVAIEARGVESFFGYNSKLSRLMEQIREEAAKGEFHYTTRYFLHKEEINVLSRLGYEVSKDSKEDTYTIFWTL
jgi:hypothetical protein